MDLTIRPAKKGDARVLSMLAMISKQSNGYNDVFTVACAEELRVTPALLVEHEYWVAESGTVYGFVCFQLDSENRAGEVDRFLGDIEPVHGCSVRYDHLDDADINGKRNRTGPFLGALATIFDQHRVIDMTNPLFTEVVFQSCQGRGPTSAGWFPNRTCRLYAGRRDRRTSQGGRRTICWVTGPDRHASPPDGPICGRRLSGERSCWHEPPLRLIWTWVIRPREACL